MSKLSSGRMSFIRSIFQRDNQRAELGISSRELLRNAQFGNMGGALDVLNTDLNGMLSLDKGMLSRFFDYSRMDEYAEISSALDIYADDATQKDSMTGKVLWVESEDDSIKDELTDLFDNRVDIENNIWEITRNLVKMGNDYEELIVGGDNVGVVGINFLPTPSMRRIEDNAGDLLGFVQTFSDNIDFTPEQFRKFQLRNGVGVNNSRDVVAFEDWRVVHMRLRSKYRESMYGWSAIDSARWIWKRLMLLEDAVLVYKLTRSPSRYAFYIDVGKSPRREAESILQRAMQRMKKQKFVNPKNGKLDLRASPLGMDQDFFMMTRDGRDVSRVESLSGPSYQQVDDVQYFLHKLYTALNIPRAYLGDDSNMPSRATLCLAGDTRVPLLDGTEPTIAELSERDDPFWVYSVDDQDNIVPGLARNARLTKRQADTVEVELDNGEVLTCTPDHPIMMRDGHYEEAGDLKAGDSVMPLYRRRSSGKGGAQKLIDYEQVYMPGDESWRYTHQMVTDSLFDRIPGGNIRHHVNFNRSDNRPDNLQYMDRVEHLGLHREHAEKTLLRPDVVAKRKAAHAEWLKTEEAAETIRKASVLSKKPSSAFWDWVHSDRHKEMKSVQMKRQWADPSGSMRASHDDKFRQKMSSVMKKRIKDGTAPDTSGSNNSKWREDANISVLIDVAKQYRCSSKKQLIKWSGYSESLINRVLSQNGISYREFTDRYMVANKMRDAAYRSDRVNHKVVSVRPGPVIDTYDLTVDGYHNFAVGQGIVVHNSQEDVKFARSVLRIQREVVNGMRRIAKVNLAAKRIDPAAVKFDLRMTVPSSIFELGQMEALRTRAELASSMERHVSHHWLLKNIYRLSDEEIESIMMQKKKDAGGEGGVPSGMGFESVTGGRIIRPQFGRSIRPLTERELFEGNPEDEKRIEKIVRRELERPDSYLGRSMRETGNLLRELAATIRTTSRAA